MRLNRLIIVTLLCLTVLLGGCATLRPDFDPPRVTVESLKTISSEGEMSIPRFEIKLRVSNPNSSELDIAGISYGLRLMGKELLHGVSSDVPKIAGYSDELITLKAGVQMFQVVRLLAGLGTNIDKPLDYKFTAKIDFNGLTPTQRVEESGEISLGDVAKTATKSASGI